VTEKRKEKKKGVAPHNTSVTRSQNRAGRIETIPEGGESGEGRREEKKRDAVLIDISRTAFRCALLFSVTAPRVQRREKEKREKGGEKKTGLTTASNSSMSPDRSRAAARNAPRHSEEGRGKGGRGKGKKALAL